MIGYSCKTLADSVGPHGIRLTTFEITFPRFILAELNTHRMLSRNSASSRAIPTEKQIERVMNFPFIPDFNKRVTGMGVGEPLTPRENRRMQAKWLAARDNAVAAAKEFLTIDKSRANRLLEPFMWHTAIVSATDWDNFFALRDHPAAQPEFRRIASMMRCEMTVHEPQRLEPGQWHLPLIEEHERTTFEPESVGVALAEASAGRCARVSYDKHHEACGLTESIDRWDGLALAGHWSPGEHPAMCRDEVRYYGNFRGFRQLRKFYPNEEVFTG